MSFGDDMASTLVELREMAEDNMRDAVLITRVDPDAPAPQMDDQGQYPEPARLTVYVGKCRLQIASVMGEASSVDAGERDGTTQGAVLQLPVLASGDVSVNDVAELTACVHDPSLVGRKFTVAGRHGKSQATARRLRVIEVTG